MATIDGDSAYAVAYRLMEKIVSNERAEDHPERRDDPRKYYLDLYRECLDATGGGE